MATTGQVHWHEGLFLQPHHLQAQQKYLLDRISVERELSMSYPYGLIEARLSPDALENMQLQFDRLRVVMKSGLEVDFPHSADLPAREFKRALEASGGGLNVLLGVPLWYAARGNTIERSGDADWGVKRLYRVQPVEHADENTGENPQTVLLRRVNAMLLFEGEDQTDLEVLPLLRIVPGVGQEVGVPRMDSGFVPPCLVLSGSAALREQIRDLAHQIDASRKELNIQLTRGGFSLDNMRGVQFEQILRLRTLNRFAARLLHLSAAPSVSPFVIYLDLRELLGELAGLHPDRDLYSVSDYDHDNPAVAFREIIANIRPLLRGAVQASYDKVAFVREADCMTATLTDAQLTRPNEYFLGIKTKQDPRGLAMLVEDADKFKFMAKSMVTSRSYGVKLAEERHPPMELPSQTGLHYFRMHRAESERMWERITREKVIGARWPEWELSDCELTLYMTIPAGGAP
jgi:type VI secretion system protein ImpJ